MNRRQRKKNRLGEFREFGFALTFRTPEPAQSLDADPFLDALIDAADARDLCLSGGTGGRYDVIVMGRSENRRTVTAEQRTALIDWLRGRPEVSDLRAGRLVDLWHGQLHADDQPT